VCPFSIVQLALNVRRWDKQSKGIIDAILWGAHNNLSLVSVGSYRMVNLGPFFSSPYRTI
jgi:hypothetical protein